MFVVHVLAAVGCQRSLRKWFSDSLVYGLNSFSKHCSIGVIHDQFIARNPMFCCGPSRPLKCAIPTIETSTLNFDLDAKVQIVGGI